MKKVKKMAFGGMSSRGPATPPAAPMRPQAAPLRGLNPQASLAKPDPALAATLAAARADAFRSGANLNPQTGLAAGPLQKAAQPGAIAKSPGQIAEYAKRIQQAGPLQGQALTNKRAEVAAFQDKFGKDAALQKYGQESARQQALSQKLNMAKNAMDMRYTGGPATPEQKAFHAQREQDMLTAANMAQQKFNPVSAGKLDAALGDVSAGTLFKKLAAAKPMSGPQTVMIKKGGAVKAKPKKYAKGGSVSSASKRGDGCAVRGKTKGRMV